MRCRPRVQGDGIFFWRVLTLLCHVGQRVHIIHRVCIYVCGEALRKCALSAHMEVPIIFFPLSSEKHLACLNRSCFPCHEYGMSCMSGLSLQVTVCF